MKTVSLALVFSLGLTGIAVASESAPAPAPAARTGMCFSPREIDTTKPISDREIVFKMRNGKMWLNTLRANCPGLKFEGGFSYTVHGDSICANLQTIRVLRGGSVCLLGEFTPYTPPEAPAQD